MRPRIPDDPEERLKAIEACEYARLNGMEVLDGGDEVRVAMSLEGKRNGFGTAHGGAIFALADQAFALACNRGAFPQVAMSATIRYLRPAGGRLEARARTEQEDERTSTVRVTVTSDGEPVAEFTGVGYKLKGRTP